jgi:hypothetical protein
MDEVSRETSPGSRCAETRYLGKISALTRACIPSHPLCTPTCGEATWGNHLTGTWGRRLTGSLDYGVNSLEGQTPHDRTAIARPCHAGC